MLDIAYVGNHGLKLQGFVNINQLNPAVGFAQANRPFTKFSDITTALNEFSSNYNALQVPLRAALRCRPHLLNSFTYSNSLDQTSASLEGNTPSVQDYYNQRADYGQSDYNLPVSNITSLIYELPVGRGRRFLSSANGFVDAVIAAGRHPSSTPCRPARRSTSPTAPALPTRFPPPSLTASAAPSLPPQSQRRRRPPPQTQTAGTGFIQYINPAAFNLPASTGSPFGNLPRNAFRNPAFYETNLSLNKKFLTPVEGLKVEFRTEFYNLINHTNLYLPSSGLSGTVGSNSTGGGVISSTFEPRTIQFGLKVLTKVVRLTGKRGASASRFSFVPRWSPPACSANSARFAFAFLPVIPAGICSSSIASR